MTSHPKVVTWPRPVQFKTSIQGWTQNITKKGISRISEVLSQNLANRKRFTDYTPKSGRSCRIVTQVSKIQVSSRSSVTYIFPVMKALNKLWGQHMSKVLGF